jgi:hypothetical protein
MEGADVVERPRLGELALEGLAGLESAVSSSPSKRMVCVKLSSFVQVTVAPGSTSMTAGSNS